MFACGEVRGISAMHACKATARCDRGPFAGSISCVCSRARACSCKIQNILVTQLARAILIAVSVHVCIPSLRLGLAGANQSLRARWGQSITTGSLGPINHYRLAGASQSNLHNRTHARRALEQPRVDKYASLASERVSGIATATPTQASHAKGTHYTHIRTPPQRRTLAHPRTHEAAVATVS